MLIWTANFSLRRSALTTAKGVVAGIPVLAEEDGVRLAECKPFFPTVPQLVDVS